MADDKVKTETETDLLTELLSIGFVIFFVLSLLTNVVGLLNLDSFLSKNFSGGIKSFSKKSLILKNTRPLSSVLSAIDSKVKVSLDEAYVYGDDLVTRYGKQKLGSIGTVLRGPVSFLGNRFFFVDFQNGKDGFVKEGELSYIESPENFLQKALLFLYKLIDIFWYSILALAIILIIVIIYLFVKLFEIRKNVLEKLFPSVIEEKGKINQNPKWEKVLTHVESQNPSDWRLAVIEADILLSELLDKMNLVGDSMGDKLKSVERSDFNTLDLAWEAHKVRNRIAHDGSDFLLTQREARRIIDLYKQVFEEFSFV